MRAECSIEDCTTPAKSRGWCEKHYRRWYEHGDPLLTKKAISVDDAFERYVVESEGCWEWLGAVNMNGYGVVSVQRTNTPAHRVAWERANGPIPSGMLIDHICRNRRCVNPAHLRLATRRQNAENIKLRTDNTSGVRGVLWHNRDHIWEVHAQSGRKRYYGGRYESLEDAKAAAIKLRNSIFTHHVEEGENHQSLSN